MVTASTPSTRVDVSRTKANSESVFLVDRRDVERGLVPGAEPVVLIPIDDAERFPGARLLDVRAAPRLLESNRLSYGGCMPLFAIEWAEAALYDQARPAIIVRDRRLAASRSNRPGTESALRGR
jgi:hypothetical protein